MAKLKKDINTSELSQDNDIEAVNDSSPEVLSDEETSETIEETELGEHEQNQTFDKDGSRATIETVASDSKTKRQKPTNISSKGEVKSEPDEHTKAILKAFAEYEYLYIDYSGSTYTMDTSERIRGAAKLYKNPYFRKQ